MKKVLLTAIALIAIASASAFGMYGDRDDWIDFLVHGNQFRARMDQIGVVLGNGTIKGTVGFRSQALGTALGNILTTGNTDLDNTANTAKLASTISAGIGYTSPVFGIGLGYNFTYMTKDLGVHTPVLTINAMNDNLRIAIPFQIAVSDNVGVGNGQIGVRTGYLGLSTDTQIRYYTGIDAFNAIRIYFKYGQSGFTVNNQKEFAQSVGFEARFYFLNTPIGNATINPYLKVKFNTALVGDNTIVRAGEALYDSTTYFTSQTDSWEKNPYDVTAAAVLGITANSDIVSLIVEPSLGYQAIYQGQQKGLPSGRLTHRLYWEAYTELYITPVKDLEWYFEMNVNNGVTASQNSQVPVYFEGTTGITWYLPAFGGDAAQ